MSSPSHHRSDSGGDQQLRIALFLTAAMMIIEGFVGWYTHSLALLADAGHMMTDTSALALSLFAAWFSKRPATPQKTYGYYRMEILAALANGVALWLIVIWIYIQAFERLKYPSAVLGAPMIAVAVIGLIVNLFCGWLMRNERSTSLNVQSAWLNVMSDALGSVGAIAAGLLVTAYGWRAADPIASMVIGVLIAVNSWRLIRQSVNILLEGVPSHLRIPDVVQAMRGVPGVLEVHDVHLWTITTGLDALSGHVMVEDLSRSEEILAGLNAVLSERFGITHTTLQLEPHKHSADAHH